MKDILRYWCVLGTMQEGLFENDNLIIQESRVGCGMRAKLPFFEYCTSNISRYPVERKKSHLQNVSNCCKSHLRRGKCL